MNKPRTAKVGAISKAQNLKGGPFGLCETPAGCKKFLKKLKGGPFGEMKKFPKKNFLMRFLNSVTVPENVKGGTLCDFLTSIVLQNIETNEGGTLWCNPKNFKKKCWKKVGLRCVFEVVDVCFFSFRFGCASEVGVVEVWSCWSLRLLNKWTKKWTFRV